MARLGPILMAVAPRRVCCPGMPRVSSLSVETHDQIVERGERLLSPIETVSDLPDEDSQHVPRAVACGPPTTT